MPVSIKSVLEGYAKQKPLFDLKRKELKTKQKENEDLEKEVNEMDREITDAELQIKRYMDIGGVDAIIYRKKLYVKMNYGVYPVAYLNLDETIDKKV